VQFANAKNRRLLKTSKGLPISEQKYWAGGRASGAGDPILFEFSFASVFAHKYSCIYSWPNLPASKLNINVPLAKASSRQE
jgi:hypothetical protein